MELIALEPLATQFHRAMHRPANPMRTVVQEPNGEITDPQAEDDIPDEIETPKSTGFHSDNQGRIWARVMLGDPEEPGCHAVVSAQVSGIDPREAKTRILHLIDRAYEFPGVRHFNVFRFYEHVDALMAIWPYVNGNAVPVASSTARGVALPTASAAVRTSAIGRRR